MTTAPLALQGVRILDLSQVAVGPYCTLLLGYMGAEVIKVESISRMDQTRGEARPTGNGGNYPGGIPGEQPWNRSVFYVNRNPNKLSLTLDLNEPRGRELLLDLATKCDAVVENFRATVMDRLGLGYQVFAEANPKLVYLKISSQGATGPEMGYGSMGYTLEQTGGLASVTGYTEGEPLITNQTVPDPIVGILGVGALVAGLRLARKTGKGTFVDLAQREATVSMLGEYLLDYSLNHRVAGVIGNRHRTTALQGCYPCLGTDMWLALTVSSDAEWHSLCQAMGQPHLAKDSRFQTALSRRQNQDDLDTIISAWTKERDHKQAMHMLQAHGVPAGAVLKGSETVVDPHLVDRFWDVLDHPDVGKYKQSSPPWRLSKTPRRRAIPSSRLGQHNKYVLVDLLGLSEQEVSQLEEEGIIGTKPIDE
ncbi:MAG: CoA transferase [Dehalococcoidia bacterium]|nr:CoA transferase [Dehalococcoidia bacterium]